MEEQSKPSSFVEQYRHLKIPIGEIKNAQTYKKLEHAVLKNAKYNNQSVILKKYNAEDSCQSYEERLKLHNDIKNELEHILKVTNKCANFVGIIGYVRESDDDPFFLVLPQMKLGLDEELKYQTKRSEAWIKKQFQIILSISTGLCYLHSFNIFHRAIKTSNIFFDWDVNSTVKIGDFGVARSLEKSYSAELLKEINLYSAPELKYQLSSEGSSVQADIFSLGVIIVEMNTLEKPLSHSNQIKNVNGIITKEVDLRSNELNKMDDPFLKKLAEECLDDNPNQRPTAKQIIEFRL